MPTATLSGQFVKITIGGTEISGYVSSTPMQMRHEMVDQTTFQTGGNPVTESMIQGALVSEFSLETNFDPAVMAILLPYVGSRSGVQVKVFSGSNALPTLSDELFSGYFSIFGFQWNYQAGQESTITWDLKIPDGATVAAPAIGTV